MNSSACDKVEKNEKYKGDNTKIAVIGAGIGGLTATALLQEQGHAIKVFERSESVKEVGTGIGIGDNMLKKLGNHDLAKGVKNAGQILSTMTVLDDKDHLLTTVKLKSDTLNVTLPRQILVDIIKPYVEDDAMFTNHEVAHIDNETDKVTIHFAEQRSEVFDLCIGADGIHPKVRQSINADSKVLYQECTCFRGLIDDIDLKHPDCAKEYWGRKGRVGIVPLSNSQAYWFITVNSKESSHKYSSFGKPYLQAYFSRCPSEVREILDKQSEASILLHNIYDLKPLKSFVYGCTILLGDAARAATPNIGQGVGQTVEDVIVLVNCFGVYDFGKALQRYDKIRVEHTAKVVKRSKEIDKIAQYRSRLFVTIRNRIMKMVPNTLAARQTKFLYKSKGK